MKKEITNGCDPNVVVKHINDFDTIETMTKDIEMPKKTEQPPLTFQEEYQAFLKAQAIKKMVHKQLKSTKISRNAPCPCNSGKKYKKCCLIY